MQSLSDLILEIDFIELS